MRNPALLATLGACALGLGACTSSSSTTSADDFQGTQKAVAQVLDDFSSAGRNRDATRICSQLLAPALVAQIRKASGTTCDAALDVRLDDVDNPDLDIRGIQVSGTTATATVGTDVGAAADRVDTFRLVRQGQNWKISQLAAG